MSIVKRSASEAGRRGGRVDLKRLRSTTDAAIARQIATDHDTAPDLSRVRNLRPVYNPPVPNVKAIRESLGLSQAAFARRFGFRVRTVQQWEQGRAVPDRPARILLKVIEKSPRTVERAIAD